MFGGYRSLSLIVKIWGTITILIVCGYDLCLFINCFKKPFELLILMRHMCAQSPNILPLICFLSACAQCTTTSVLLTIHNTARGNVLSPQNRTHLLNISGSL